MTQTATVCATAGDTATVLVMRQSACSGCHAGGCFGCGKAVCAEAYNTVGATTGDTVELETATTRVLGAAALVFLLPLVAMLVGYLVGAVLSLSEGWRALCAFGGLAAAFVGLYFYTRVRGVQVPLRITRVLSHQPRTETTTEEGESAT